MDIRTPPITLSAREAAELLGVSRWAIYDAAKRGELDVVRVGSRLRVAGIPLYRALGLYGERDTFE